MQEVFNTREVVTRKGETTERIKTQKIAKTNVGNVEKMNEGMKEKSPTKA